MHKKYADYLISKNGNSYGMTLGEKFYRRLVSAGSEKLIDFDNPENNTFHVTAEFS